ncbi:MAG: FkbM family methyltransferase, partial [Candidatus Peregrinibacteria bacterium]
KILDPAIISAKSCIIDIGGHKGMFAIYARCLNEKVPIFVYEPEEENFRDLKENLKINHLKDIYPHSQAVTGHNGEGVLYISPDSHNHSFIPYSPDAPSKKVNTTKLETIFDRLAKKGITTCDVLKVDAEGAEFEIFAATPPEILKKCGTIIIEYHNYQPGHNETTLKNHLTTAGFRVKSFPSRYDKRFGLIYAGR